jgi:hypothetical protein
VRKGSIWRGKRIEDVCSSSSSSRICTKDLEGVAMVVGEEEVDIMVGEEEAPLRIGRGIYRLDLLIWIVLWSRSRFVILERIIGEEGVEGEMVGARLCDDNTKLSSWMGLVAVCVFDIV